MDRLRIVGWLSALLVVGAFLSVSSGVPAVLGQSATPGAVTATAPEWSFVVHGMQDPYAGELTNPQERAVGMRYVGFDVEVVNASEQPLTFGANSVFLRDDEGFSYRGGNATGGEPALQGRTMPGGERARGWVWFEVPEGATLTEIVLVPIAPELGVGLDEVESIAGATGSASTPAPGVTPSPEVIATEPAAPTVTPLPTEEPAPAATATRAPAGTVSPTSVIIIEGAETSEGAVAATVTPAAVVTPEATATPAAAAAPEATETPAIVTTAPTATAPATEIGIEEGSTVVTGDSDANLRGGPSLDAEIVGTIPLGSELTVTGPAVVGDDFIWWPVLVVATGEEGYVAEELLSPIAE